MFKKLILVQGILLSLQTLLYFGCEFFQSKIHNVKRPVDDKIPFLPWTVLPYCFWFPMIAFYPLIVFRTDPYSYCSYLMTMVMEIVLSVVCYLIYPTSFQRPVPPDGVQSTKVYMTYGYKIDDDGILEVLKKMKELHGITAFHCENHYVVEHLKKEYGDAGKTAPIYHAKSRPNLAEAEAVRRVLYLAKLAGDAPVYIVHLSCKESLEAVEEARRNGQKNIFVETCTQYLTLTEDRYKDPDGLKYIMSPPLRTQQDLDALWKGLEAGEIQIVATDHCPFNYAKEKQDGKDDFRKCPNGAPGVEERMILLFSEGVMKNKISINKLVEVACTNPAKVYGMYPKKGIIEPGADGDLIIIDADAKQTLTHEMMHGAVDYTSYEGTDLHGKIDLVMQRGNIIAENNEFKGNRGDGKYLYRKPFLGDL